LRLPAGGSGSCRSNNQADQSGGATRRGLRPASAMPRRKPSFWAACRRLRSGGRRSRTSSQPGSAGSEITAAVQSLVKKRLYHGARRHDASTIRMTRDPGAVRQIWQDWYWAGGVREPRQRAVSGSRGQRPVRQLRAGAGRKQQPGRRHQAEVQRARQHGVNRSNGAQGGHGEMADSDRQFREISFLYSVVNDKLL